MAQRTNTDTGKPSGNRPMDGTGIPAQIHDGNRGTDERLTEEYTDDDNGLQEGVRELHPNRNPNKGQQ